MANWKGIAREFSETLRLVAGSGLSSWDTHGEYQLYDSNWQERGCSEYESDREIPLGSLVPVVNIKFTDGNGLSDLCCSHPEVQGALVRVVQSGDPEVERLRLNITEPIGFAQAAVMVLVERGHKFRLEKLGPGDKKKRVREFDHKLLALVDEIERTALDHARQLLPGLERKAWFETLRPLVRSALHQLIPQNGQKKMLGQVLSTLTETEVSAYKIFVSGIESGWSDRIGTWGDREFDEDTLEPIRPVLDKLRLEHRRWRRTELRRIIGQHECWEGKTLYFPDETWCAAPREIRAG